MKKNKQRHMSKAKINDYDQTYDALSGRGTCTCMAWRFSKAPKWCKHLTAAFGDNPNLRGTLIHRVSVGSNRSLPKRALHPVPMSYYHVEKENVDNGHYWVSVKYNGIFTRWDGSQLLTKSGKAILNVPEHVAKHLPPGVKLDGELYGKSWTNTMNAMHGHFSPEVRFMVFDLVDTRMPWIERYKELTRLNKKHKFHLVIHHPIRTLEEFHHLQKEVAKHGEEGLVLRHDEGLYTPGKRVRNTLKWKPMSRGTATVKQCTKSPQRGYTLLVEENKVMEGKQAVFKLNSMEAKRVGEQVHFVYSGRHENGTPEIPRIK